MRRGDAGEAGVVGVVGLGDEVGVGWEFVDDEAGDGEIALADGVDGEEGLVDGAQVGGGDEEDGEAEDGGEVGDHEVGLGGIRVVVEGDVPSAGAFDEEEVSVLLPEVEGGGDAGPVGGALIDLGGEVGGDGGGGAEWGEVGEEGGIVGVGAGGAGRRWRSRGRGSRRG